MRGLLRDLPPMLWYMVFDGLAGRVEDARDSVKTPWLAAYQPAPVAKPATVDAERVAAWSDGASARVELVGVELELEQARAELIQRTRERDAARAAITGVSAPLLQRTVALGKANAEITQLRADVERLTSELDAIDDAALESAETLKQLRQDLADARNQEQGTPISGQTVALRLEDGKTVTGLLMDHGNRRMVNGWLVDVHGRSLLPMTGGGGDRG